jgi:glycosyltransferase involved in cell wall biosynthesis
VFVSARRLSRRLRREPVDVIHAHTRVAQVIAEWLWRRHRIPYVTTWHGFYRPHLGRRWWPCAGQATIAISEPVAAHVREAFGVPPQQIHTIPHGVDVARFASGMEADRRCRLGQEFNLPGGPGAVIGTVARLVPSKGVAQLVEAFALVAASHPQARLLIAGDGEDRPRLERLARRLGIAEAVRFAGSRLESREALPLMDIFVFPPAAQEGFGLSLLEAMAAGRPIVSVRRGGGSTWLLQDSGVGVLVEPNQPQELARAITRLLDDPQLARQSAAHAQAVARQRYDAARMIDAVERVYAGVSSRP